MPERGARGPTGPDDPHETDMVFDDTADREERERQAMLAAQRDLRAFAPIYQQYHQTVFGYAHRRLRDHDLAADAVSLTFSRALTGIHGYRSGSVPGWLFAITRNVVADLGRTRRRHADLDLLDAAGELPGAEPSPADQAIAADQGRALRDAIARLTPDQRAVVELRLAGLTGPAIATALGLSLAATKSSQFRAYARLRQLLADEGFFMEGDQP